jgi:hypothetical protein
MILMLVSLPLTTLAQDLESKNTKSKRNWLKFGADFGLAYSNPKEINSLVSNWLMSSDPLLNSKLWEGIHFGFSGTLYSSVTVLRILEIRPQYGFSYSPYFMMTNNAEFFNSNITFEFLGMSAGICLGPLRFGGGLDKYYSRINWKDDFYRFDDIWRGNSFGFNAYVGLDRHGSKHGGTTYTLIYRNALIEELINQNDHIVTSADGNRNVGLGLTGFEFRIGFYFGI